MVRYAGLLVVLAVGCAKPNEFRERDGAAGEDAAPVTDQGAPSDRQSTSPDAPHVPPPDGAALPDVPLDQGSPDLGIDRPFDVAADLSATDTLPPSPDVETRKAGGATCVESSECASGNCSDGVCCTQSCSVCQQCKAPGGTCQSIPAGQPDNFPADACTGTGSCDGASVPKCVQCTKCSDGSCIRSRYDFESGRLDGVGADGPPWPLIATGPPYMGNTSMGLVMVMGETAGGFIEYFDVCPAPATASLRDRVFRLRIFLEPTLSSGALWLVQLFMQKEQAAILEIHVPVGTWALLEGRLPALEDADVNRLSLYVQKQNDVKWAGRIWVDDVRIE